MILEKYLAQFGRNGDTELAHVTKEEKQLLQSLGGAGTTNPITGFKEYYQVLQDDNEELTDIDNWTDWRSMDPGNFIYHDYETTKDLHKMSEKDYYKYMPSYDFRKEKVLRTRTGQDISRTGESAQDSLLNMAMKGDVLRSRQDFAGTGNPMIDRQRRNVLTGVTNKIDDRWSDLQETILSDQEDYMEKWAKTVIKYESNK